MLIIWRGHSFFRMVSRSSDFVTICSEQNLTAREECEDWRGGDSVGLYRE